MINVIRVLCLAPVLLFGNFATAHDNDGQGASQPAVTPRQQAEESALKFDSALRSLSDVMINTAAYASQVDVIKHLFDLREANLKIVNDLRGNTVVDADVQLTFKAMETQYLSYGAIDASGGSAGANRLVQRHIQKVKDSFKILKTDIADLTATP